MKAKDLPQDKASKAKRAIAKARKAHEKRRTLKPAFPNRAKPAKNSPRRDHAERPVQEIRKQIKVIKRAGGTVQFARSLKKVAKQENIRRHKNATKLNAEKSKGEKKAAKPFKVCKMRAVYQTQLPMRLAAAKGSKKHYKNPTKLRKSLVPGTVCIILAGRHQSKKCVFLKQLRRSGLCLITGPYGVNKVPLRRMDQQFMQPTSIRLPLPEGFKVPGHVDDSWFKKKRGTKSQVTTKVTDSMVKNVKKTKAKPDLSRKKAQRFVDEAFKSSEGWRQTGSRKITTCFQRTAAHLPGNCSRSWVQSQCPGGWTVLHGEVSNHSLQRGLKQLVSLACDWWQPVLQ